MCNKGGLLLGEMDGFGRRRFHLQIHEKNRHHSRTFLRASSSRFAKISHNQDVQFYDFFPLFASLFPQQKWPFFKEIAVKMRSKREIKNPGMPYAVRLSGVSCGYSHSITGLWFLLYVGGLMEGCYQYLGALSLLFCFPGLFAVILRSRGRKHRLLI